MGGKNDESNNMTNISNARYDFFFAGFFPLFMTPKQCISRTTLLFAFVMGDAELFAVEIELVFTLVLFNDHTCACVVFLRCPYKRAGLFS